MKSHEECAALLDAFIDGELSADAADAVREHLAECDACRAYVSDALAMRELFPDMEETVVPDGFAESVIAALPPQITITPPESASVTQITETPQTASESQSAETAQTASESQITPTAVKRWKRWINLAAPLAACLAMVLLIHGFYDVFRPKGGAAPDSEAALTMDGGAGYGAASSSAADSGAGGAIADENASEDMEEVAPQDIDEYQIAEVTPEEGAARSASESDNGARASGANGTQSAASGANRNASDYQNGASQSAEVTSESADASAFDVSSGDGLTLEAVYGGDTAPTPEPSGNEAISDYVAPSAKSAETEARTAEAPPQSPETPSASMGAPETPSEDKASTTSETPPEEESAPDIDAESLSVWTLSAGGASLLERYRPIATTERGAWYALTDAQFDALWDALAYGDLSATLEACDAAPPKIVPNAVYVLLSSN